MKDLITAVGLLLLIEGLFFAIFPSRIKNMLISIKQISDEKLRNIGFFFFILGSLIIWYIKSK
jgi:uncharacterized protein YjeT (DUF2065 family)|tara:strand:+ start:479 stop:667 length:189 start_codon:yes stop_codon:yes gene_type:complete